jgi:hypothetical protein
VARDSTLPGAGNPAAPGARAGHAQPRKDVRQSSHIGAILTLSAPISSAKWLLLRKDKVPRAGPGPGVYHRIPMEQVAPGIECVALRARGAKRTRNSDGSVNGRPLSRGWSERCQAKRWLAPVSGLPYAAEATGVWLLGSASGQPATPQVRAAVTSLLRTQASGGQDT